MPAYVFTREKDPKSISIRSIVNKRLAPASFKEHPVVFAPDMVVKKSWRGPRSRRSSSSTFPAMRKRRPGITARQAASETRFRGGDYSFILTDGIALEWLATLSIYHCGLTEISFRGRSWGSRRETTPWES